MDEPMDLEEEYKTDEQLEQEYEQLKARMRKIELRLKKKEEKGQEHSVICQSSSKIKQDKDNSSQQPKCKKSSTAETNRKKSSTASNATITELTERLAGLIFLNKLRFPGDDKIYDFKSDDFESLDTIWNGKCRIEKVVHKLTTRKLAVKYIQLPISRSLDKRQEYKIKQLQREIEIHRELDANSVDYVLQFYGVCLHENEILICMELMDKSLTDFYTMIHTSHKFFPEEFLGYVTVILVKAMCVLLSLKVMHRDIKPDNILVNNQGQIKLCDFGESIKSDSTFAEGVAGTLLYVPPEQLLSDSHKYDEHSEVWSLAITLLELIMGKWPYFEQHENEKTNRIDQVVLMNRINIEATDDILKMFFNDRFYALTPKFLKCCLREVKQRPKFVELQTQELYHFYLHKRKLAHIQNKVEALLDENDRSNTNNRIKFNTCDLYYDYFFTIKDCQNGRRSRSLENGERHKI